MDLGHLKEDVPDLLAVLPIRLSRQFHHALEILQRGVVVALLRVHSSHDLVDLAVTCVVGTLELFIHLKRFLEEADRISVVTCFEVALA